MESKVNEVEPVEPTKIGRQQVRVAIFKQGEIYRVHPPVAIACVNEREGPDEILFSAVDVEAEVLLPEGAVEGASQWPIPPEGLVVRAGRPGVYSYRVRCLVRSEYQYAVANSDPTLIVSRRP
jgi:hypothetical protein